jgi:hypothetical protein
MKLRALVGIALLGVSVLVFAAPAAPTGWVPTQGLRWQYQLQGVVRTDLCVRSAVRGAACVRPQVYDIDPYNNDGTALNSDAVTAIHAQGAHAVCYVDAGTWGNWRPDQAAYPSSVLGASNGWPGEKWLDIRRTDVLMPIIDARVAKCVAAGFDAVEFDNVDGYTNETGFPLTASDQLPFNEALAADAHSHGLAVGLKNDLDQLTDLQSQFDFAINEQCAQYQECDAYAAWLAAGKAVVEVEYRGSVSRFCADAALHGRDAIKKRKSLKATPYKPCR